MHEGGRVVVVFAGGGTGGHLYPALALADALQEVRPDVQLFFVGAKRGLEARVLPARALEHVLLPVRGLRRGTLWGNLGVSLALVRSVVRLAGLFRRLRPRLVVVTGGYAGAPAGFAAVTGRVPLVLQEQNRLPGVTTRLLSRWAKQIHLAFPEAVDRLPERSRSRTRPSGNPIRPPQELDAQAARARFGIPAEGPVLLVVGGSQGSAAINRLVLGAVQAVEAGRLERPEGLQLLWATGPTHESSVRTALEKAGAPPWVHVLGYIDDMPSALAMACLAVSRSGAMTTSEFHAWSLPAILIPLPTSAEDHQARNAEALEEAGVAEHLPEPGLTVDALWARTADLIDDPDRLAAMGTAAGARARPDAALQIARELAELLPAAPTSGEGATDP